MGRSRKRSAAGKGEREEAEKVRADIAGRPVAPPKPRRPNKSLLAAAVLAQTAWIVFLLIVACCGR